MILGFAHFGNKFRKVKQKTKKQDRKRNEINMKNHQTIMKKSSQKPWKKLQQKQYVFRGPQKSYFFAFGGVLEPTWTQKYEF